MGYRLRGAALGLVACAACASDPVTPTRCDETRVATPGVVQDTGAAAAIFWVGALGCLGPGESDAEAVEFMRLAGFDGATGAESFRALRFDGVADESGTLHIRLQEVAAGLDVVGAVVTLHVDDATGQVMSVTGEVAVVPEGFGATPALDEAEALGPALSEAGIFPTAVYGPPTVAAFADLGAAELVWTQLFEYTDAEGQQLDRIYASATDGRLVARHPQLHRELDRRVYDGASTTSQDLPNLAVILDEGGTTTDAQAQTLYDNAGIAYTYYRKVHDRDSYDGRGAELPIIAHYCNLCANAFWTGTALAFSDGGTFSLAGRTVTALDFGRALDIVVHEVTHAVDGETAGLVYRDESGALDESMADVMGVAASSWARAAVIDEDVWRIGEAIFTDPTLTLRNARDPASGPAPTGIVASYPDTYGERYTGSLDNGGVHINSGVSNLAFSLLVLGGQHPRGDTAVVVPALGMEKAERIFHHAHVDFLSANSTFETMRYATASAAALLYGRTEFDAVHDAWDAVGVPGDSSTCLRGSGSPATDDPCSSHLNCDSCTRSSQCGWCGNACRTGTDEGPTEGTCSRWAFEPGQCGGSTRGGTTLTGDECFVARPVPAGPGPGPGGPCAVVVVGRRPSAEGSGPPGAAVLVLSVAALAALLRRRPRAARRTRLPARRT